MLAVADTQPSSIDRSRLTDESVKRILELALGEGKLTVTVEEAGRLMGISRALAYDAARMKVIPTIRIGTRLVVPVPALLRVLESPSLCAATA